MLAAIRLTAQVLLGVALFEVALGALWPLLGLQLEQQRVSTELTSIVGSAYYAGFVLGTMFCFPIIDRVGHIRAFSVFAVLAANATLLHVVVPNPISWAVLRAVIGFALAGVFTIVESWLNDKATTETRGRIFALYTMVAWGFSGIGPLGINIHDDSGTILFCLIGIVMASAIIPVALTTVGNPDIGQRSHFGILRLYKISPLGVLACFASGVINTGLFVLLPIYSTRVGNSTAETSILLSIASTGPLFIQYPVGWMADRFGRRPLMLATTLIAIGVSAAIVSLPHGSLLLARRAGHSPRQHAVAALCAGRRARPTTTSRRTISFPPAPACCSPGASAPSSARSPRRPRSASSTTRTDCSISSAPAMCCWPASSCTA